MHGTSYRNTNLIISLLKGKVGKVTKVFSKLD